MDLTKIKTKKHQAQQNFMINDIIFDYNYNYLYYNLYL